jgi:hypothetical protein
MVRIGAIFFVDMIDCNLLDFLILVNLRSHKLPEIKISAVQDIENQSGTALHEPIQD